MISLESFKEYATALAAEFHHFMRHDSSHFFNATIFSKEFYSGKRAIRFDLEGEKKEIVVSDECPSLYLHKYKEKIEKLKGKRIPRSILEKRFPINVSGKVWDSYDRSEAIKNYEEGNKFIGIENSVYIVRPNSQDWWRVEDASSDFTCLALTIMEHEKQNKLK